MKLHNYGKFPDGYKYEYGNISPLDPYDIENLEKAGVEEAWYWYAESTYEGSGQILMRIGQSYDIHDMGHCSCYGPTDNLSVTARYSGPDDIKARCTEEAYKEISPLIDMAFQPKTKTQSGVGE